MNGKLCDWGVSRETKKKKIIKPSQPTHLPFHAREGGRLFAARLVGLNKLLHIDFGRPLIASFGPTFR